MQHNFSILFYSRYSQFSMQLLEAMQHLPVDFAGWVNLRLLCVDNEKVRSKVTNQPPYYIDRVPTLIVTYLNGGVEKYVDDGIFKYIDDIVNSLLPPPPPPPPAPIEPIILAQPMTPPPPPAPAPAPAPAVVRQISPQFVVPQSGEETGIESLIEEQDELDPPLLEKEEPMNATEAKSRNLMATAMQMQKDRD
jgi:hypothetical protein